jgi:AcrR family transcriptional regulator
MSHAGAVDTATSLADSARTPGRLGTTLSRRAAIDAATRVYLAGGVLDMSSLADELGVGRSTLYRWVGNREDLLGTVLAEAAVRTFRKAAAGAGGKGGVHHVLDVLERFMRAVIAAAPLQALSKHEPLLLVRVAMMPGQVEAAASRMIAEMLETEVAAGRLEIPLPPAVFGEAIVRLCDAHLYAPLLGRDEPDSTGSPFPWCTRATAAPTSTPGA